MTEFGDKRRDNQLRPLRMENKDLGRLINETSRGGNTQGPASREFPRPQYSRKVINPEEIERRNLEINNVRLDKRTPKNTPQKEVAQRMVVNSQVNRKRKISGLKETSSTAVAKQNSPVANLVHDALKKEHSYGRLGLIVGLICILGGIGLLLNGVAGATSWTAKVLGLESQISDAPPGIALAIVGLFIVWVTKPRVKISDLK